MMQGRIDAGIVRAVLRGYGVREGSPVLLALERLEAKTTRYEWVLPILTGDDAVLDNERTARLALALVKGHTGEAVIIEAMKT